MKAAAPITDMLTLDHLNGLSQADFTQALDGTYEHSPWIAEAAWAHRPFASLAALKHAMVTVLAQAGVDAQLRLIRAHPELAGKAMVSRTLTAESTHEQGKAGLTDCTPDEFARIQQMNADYNAKFGFPFILAVRGPRGTGLDKREEVKAAQAEGRLRKDIDWRIAMKRGQLRAMPEGPCKALYEWFERRKAQVRAREAERIRKALARKAGARGLRSILEQSLMDTMFELPSIGNVEKVVVDDSTIEEGKPPLLVYREAARQA